MIEKNNIPEEQLKYLDISEFVNDGLLLEVNRLFFHPIGLALSVAYNHDGKWTLDNIIDYREDEEGVIYGDIDNLFIDKYVKANTYINKRLADRFARLGYIIQDIPRQEKQITHINKNQIGIENHAVLVRCDDWEELYINSISVESGHTINEGEDRLKCFMNLSKEYNFKLENLEIAYITDSILLEDEEFPMNLNEFEHHQLEYI
jgi:adenylate kinase family enzyme